MAVLSEKKVATDSIPFQTLFPTSISFHKKLGLRLAHNNVKAAFNGFWFFSCKSWLNQLNSKMQGVNYRGLNDLMRMILVYIKIITGDFKSLLGLLNLN